LQKIQTNKLKIINDPVYGFIRLPSELIFDLIEHPWFQRLRRISQLGLTYHVYPGAYHTRFHHALGAMHLMQQAIGVLRSKGHAITDEEAEAASIAILLHDIGHGPFSHALEYSIVSGISHEFLSVQFMEALNKQFDGKLELAIKIFKGQYHKTFLHQLISSQLDVDRLDYLRRDSFYTGVAEGAINADRLISMMNVADNHLVVDAKGVYSVEKFIVARRLMYWQVYLHKTVLSAEFMLEQILRRATELCRSGQQLFTTSALKPFLNAPIVQADFSSEGNFLKAFALLDDFDIWACIKEWRTHDDVVLAYLSNALLDRKLLQVMAFDNQCPDAQFLEKIKSQIVKKWKISNSEADFLLIHREISNSAYTTDRHQIRLLYRNGDLIDVAQAADHLNISALARPVNKHFVCFPKNLI
jgi:uncharacterized protein